ncbi:putative ring finger containing protein [Tripterygium wilfordii]|uniref:RING-type E3 ubiquitin transferase n=1 Tax=Tripterygium wilfordii TaxID=458696 RepID=A0A7J7CKE2_TRIWF|nr:general transcriptional corepressor trfA-like [Tripterygium wilfordii]KAF5734535.1 putative ring finger containing protein [Tripterygium wilfordii]
MPVFTESSSSAGVAEQKRLRRLNTRIQVSLRDAISTESTTTADPEPQISSIIQSARCKSTIFSLFLSSSSPPKKKSSTFRGLGCTAGASQQVSVPAAIRKSAVWEEKKVKKKKKKKSPPEQKQKKNINNEESKALNFERDRESCVVFPDVWCGPGIGFSADAVGSVDCVVARRNNVSGRGKIDNQRERERERERARERDRDRDRERERPPFFARRTVNPDTLPFLDSDTSFVTSHPEPEVFGSRYYPHVQHPSPDAIAEIMMLQNSLLMGGRIDQHDRFRDWRLDVDDMSYEELLELGERIGYVSTGLKANEIGRCLMKIKQPISSDLSLHLTAVVEKKCSICQEEYEASDELGKLHCGHTFHIECIRQWLGQKNACPVCKTAAVTRG